MWVAGAPASEIAEKLGTTRNAVIGRANRTGLRRRPPLVPDDAIQRALERYQNGGTLVEAARGICHPVSLGRRFREMGVSVRRGGSQPDRGLYARDEVALARFNSGECLRDIAVDLGVGISAVCKAVHRTARRLNVDVRKP